MYCKNCGDKSDPKNKFCKNCGTEVVSHERFYHHIGNWFKEYKWAIIVVVLILVALIAFGSDDTSSTDTTTPPAQTTTTVPATPAPITSADQATIGSFEVDILCGDSGGSGTIITSNGIVLTNNHIIPQDSDGNPTVDKCIVTLPDAQGKIDRIYYGTPVILQGISKEYDLAFININEVYKDDDGIAQGEYPTTFPNFNDSGCSNNAPTLGESVRVFGYPAISAGGYYLTITSGIVSALPNDDTIVTSAKVDHGDSGGIAVDENGCMIGVPSMVSGDGNESLGVIYSNTIVNEFIGKAEDMLKNTDNSSGSTN